MRKLRKKIYKYSVTHKMQPKPKDSGNGVMERLKDRRIPQFLMESVKKRRNIELNGIKNVIVSDGVSLADIKNMRVNQ